MVKWHWVRGRHNQIPVCCILAYLAIPYAGDWVAPYGVDHRVCWFHWLIGHKPLTSCHCETCYWVE